MTSALSELVPGRPAGPDELPWEDSENMESKRHRELANVLIETLDAAWADRNDFYVAGNTFLYFSELQRRSNDFRGPDVFIVLGTERKERKSWVVWEEGGRAPNVVIEIVSPTTEAVDRGDKMRIYASVLRVPEYFLFDPATERLEGYGLDIRRGEYVPLGPNAHGDLESAQLKLAIGLRPGKRGELAGPFLRWISPDGSPLPTGDERAEAERERAEAERERAERAEERVRLLAEQLRKAGIEPPST